MRRVTHALLTVTAAVCWLAVLAPSASADGMGGADVDDSGIDYGIITTGGNSGGSTSGGDSGTGPTCTYRLMGGPENFPVYDTDGTLIEVQAGGAWYEKTCDGAFVGAVYLTATPETVNPATLAAGVLRRMTIPLPDVSLSPAVDQIVNLPSWLWISNWAPLTGSATLGGVTVTVTAQPSTARWVFGDGNTSTCAPGVEWSPDANPAEACTHTWAKSSAAEPSDSYRLRLAVNWTASYTVSGGAGGGTLPPLTRTAELPVRVAEVQAINDHVGGSR